MSRVDKDAERLYQQEYYSRNRESVGIKAREYRRLVAGKLADYKSDTPCADCDTIYPPQCMDFDHRDPSTKIDNVGRITSWPAMRREIDKCDLVCANCHRLRTFPTKL